MKTYLIGYDLNKQGQNYDCIIGKIKAISDGWWHCLDSTWIIKTNYTAVQIRDYLKSCYDSNDNIIVVLLGDEIAWNLNKECAEWLTQHFRQY